MLVELGLVEQRDKAVLEVLEGAATVTDVARRYGVSRHTVHKWLVRYGGNGLAGLTDKSSKPDTCPHQMPPVVEAKVVELRRAHPEWGPRTILNRLIRLGVEPLASRSAVHRCSVRQVLLESEPRKRRPSDYKRWERSPVSPLVAWYLKQFARTSLATSAEVFFSAETGVTKRLFATPTSLAAGTGSSTSDMGSPHRSWRCHRARWSGW